MITLAIVIILLISLYYYGTRNFKYWEERGVKFDKPLPFFGNNLKGYTFKASMTSIGDELYWKYPNEQVVGFFRSTRLELLIRDPEIVKRILTTDFAHFFERGFMPHKTVFEPLMQNLFFAEGDLWKLLRQRMSPAFTTGKLKAMFPLIVDRAERLKTRALTVAAENKSIDARELMARYTTDFIGACGFGLDSDSLNDENSAFRQLGINIFKARPREIAIVIAKELFPEMFKNLKILSRAEKDINELVGEILRKRNYKPSGRGDFIDLMLECKEKGVIVGESIQKKNPDGTPETVTLEFNDGLISAQVFIFFAAGFETSSSATSYTLHQLAYNQDVQKKVQEEVDRVLAKHDGKLSYDSIKEMTYLEMAFKEGLRMFPSLGFLLRQCTRPFTFPELNLTIDENVRVMIPLQSLHNDPKYFPNPEEFKPERFDPEAYDNNNKYFYLPFGAGPRACIGDKSTKTQLIAIYRLEFYKNKKNWKLYEDVNKEPPPTPKTTNKLNKTYNVGEEFPEPECDVEQVSPHNKAFLGEEPEDGPDPQPPDEPPSLPAPECNMYRPHSWPEQSWSGNKTEALWQDAQQVRSGLGQKAAACLRSSRMTSATDPAGNTTCGRQRPSRS